MPDKQISVNRDLRAGNSKKAQPNTKMEAKISRENGQKRDEKPSRGVASNRDGLGGIAWVSRFNNAAN